MIYRFRKKLVNRYYLHRYLQPFCKKQLNTRSYSSQNTIAIYAQPRSGSTWLAEILKNIPNGLILNEPLWRGFLRTDGKLPGKFDGRLNETRTLNFYYYQPIPEEENWQEAEVFFDKLFRGGIPKLGLYSLNTTSQLQKKDLFIFKFCYGNLMFHWHLSHFNIKPIVLIRHPCAVIASQLKNIGYKYVINKPFFQLPNFRYNEYFAPYLDILKNIHTPEGILAAFWAINTMAITGQHQHKKEWYSLPYEKLYLNTHEETGKLFDWLEKSMPPLIEHSLFKPSVTASVASQEILKKRDPIHHLGKWKKELNQKQIATIMHIVHDIGVDFYSAGELEPDYHKFPF